MMIGKNYEEFMSRWDNSAVTLYSDDVFDFNTENDVFDFNTENEEAISRC